jgi:sec-independent protein translocase protein TatC
MADKLMTFGEHLEELRRRLKYAAYSVIVCTLVCYAFSEFLFAFLAQPLIRAWGDAGLGKPQLHFANPIEPFFTFLKISLVAGIFASSPIIFYQIWRFVAPGLYRREKVYALPFAIASAIFFLGGASFGYFLVFPYGFKFFLGFAKSNMGRMEKLMGQKVGLSLDHTFKLTPTLMMGEYFSLVWRLLLAFGLIFELPLVVFFLAMAGLVNPKALWRFNRYFIVLSFVVGAVLTPPDVITQVFMAAPLLVLYNLSILFSLIFVKRRERRKAAEAEAKHAGPDEAEATVEAGPDEYVDDEPPYIHDDQTDEDR